MRARGRVALQHLGGRWWATLEELTWSNGVEAKVPLWFKTDGASIPWFLRWIVTPWGDWGLAAIFHDAEYWFQTKPRKEADELFLKVMDYSGVYRMVRLGMWASVRMCGWWPWWLNKRAKARGETRVLKALPEPLDGPAPRKGLDWVIERVGTWLHGRKVA